MGETQEKEGTWTQEGETVTITIDDQPQAFTLTDGNLIPADESMPAVFSKEAPAVAEKPAPVAAESEDAFVGEWDMTAIDMMGMYMTKDLLEAAGTDFDHVVKTTCFLADMDDFAAFNEEYAKSFGENKPARSCVAVKTLPKGALVEVEVIAEA